MNILTYYFVTLSNIKRTEDLKGKIGANQSPGTIAFDSEVPPPGGHFLYLVRAMNACPAGTGTLGTGSSGQPRVGPSCP